MGEAAVQRNILNFQQNYCNQQTEIVVSRELTRRSSKTSFLILVLKTKTKGWFDTAFKIVC